MIHILQPLAIYQKSACALTLYTGDVVIIEFFYLLVAHVSIAYNWQLNKVKWCQII